MDYALQNDIYIGSVQDPFYHFTNAEIVLNSAKGNFAVDVLSNELSADQFSVTVRPTNEQIGARDAFITSDDLDFITADYSAFYVLDEDGEPDPEDIAYFMGDFPFGTPVLWKVNNLFMARGYTKSIERVSKRAFKITCTSGIGLLDTKMHTGGLYSNKPIIELISEIVGSSFEWIPSQDLDRVTVSGHLPYDTARNNLHRVLFASGAIMRKPSSGLGIWGFDYMVGFPMQVGADIPPSAMALQGSVQYQLPANAVEVTEHAFFETADEPTETLYESSEPVSNLLVLFDKPIVVASMNPTASLTVNESHVNYAIVSGYGTLTGKPYTHTTQIRRMTNNEVGNAERVKRCADNELVNSLNSYNVAKRMLSYFGKTKTVKAKVLLGENFHMLRAGQLYNFVNPYGEVASGYLTKQDALVTSVVGSQCSFVTGYLPDANGNTFTQRLTIDASYIATHGATWTVPQGTTYIRLVLIGGGSGGQGGTDGENGAGLSEMTETHQVTEYDITDAYTYANANQRKPKGGNGGTAGASGKVLVVEIAVTPGQTTITFALGQAGAGGARGGSAGSVGTHTTATIQGSTYDSDNGTQTIGYVEPFSGEVYASPGADGVKGGDGGQTDTVDLLGASGAAGLPGEAVGNYRGGVGGDGLRYDYSNPVLLDVSYLSSSGGAGGGAAYGANGGNGGSATRSGTTPQETWRTTTGKGGDGADAVAPTKGAYGSGGAGGHGGGAGGNAGGMHAYCTNSLLEYTITIGAAGVGGHGTAGADGGDGVALIYY